jgi:hypothetical protein
LIGDIDLTLDAALVAALMGAVFLVAIKNPIFKI